ELIREIDLDYNPEPNIVLEPSSVTFSPDSKHLAVLGGRPGTVHLVEIATGKVIREFLGDLGSGRLDPVVFSADGQIVAILGGNRVYLWDSATGQPIATAPGHQGAVWSVAFSPDNRILATADLGTVRHWDTVSSRLIRRIPVDKYWERC